MNKTLKIAQNLWDNPGQALAVTAAVEELRRLAAQQSSGMLMLVARAPNVPTREAMREFDKQYKSEHGERPDGVDRKDWVNRYAVARETFMVIGWPTYYAKQIAAELAK